MPPAHVDMLLVILQDWVLWAPSDFVREFSSVFLST